MFVALNISPAPQPIQYEIEVFGAYKSENEEKEYQFHLWMLKENRNDLFGKIYLPFTCTTVEKMFCLYESENVAEKGGEQIWTNSFSYIYGML